MIFSDLSFIINTDKLVIRSIAARIYSFYEAIYTDNLLKTLILMSMYVDLYLGNLL
jgi:hypothetical protein